MFLPLQTVGDAPMPFPSTIPSTLCAIVGKIENEIKKLPKKNKSQATLCMQYNSFLELHKHIALVLSLQC